MSLQLKDASVIRGGRRLVDRVNVWLRPGQMTAVLGPNGAGKTTLLGLASEELTPDEGGVLLDGRALADYSPLEIARRRAVVPQLSGLGFPFSVREVVALGRYPHGDARTPRGRDAISRALTSMALEHLSEAPFPRLSGGEQQRTHAARALAQVDGAVNPWLLLDEPTSALDLVHQHGLLGQVRSFVRAGGGALIVLHDPNLASRYADHLVLMAGGRVVADGPAEQVMQPGLLEQTYGVSFELVPITDRPPLVVPGPRS